LRPLGEIHTTPDSDWSGDFSITEKTFDL